MQRRKRKSEKFHKRNQQNMPQRDERGQTWLTPCRGNKPSAMAKGRRVKLEKSRQPN